jgi:hypothetical protein
MSLRLQILHRPRDLRQSKSRSHCLRPRRHLDIAASPNAQSGDPNRPSEWSSRLALLRAQGFKKRISMEPDGQPDYATEISSRQASLREARFLLRACPPKGHTHAIGVWGSKQNRSQRAIGPYVKGMSKGVIYLDFIDVSTSTGFHFLSPTFHMPFF